MIHEIIGVYLWMIIPMIGLLAFYRIRTFYKIEQLKAEKKIRKHDESFQGSIHKFLDDAPDQLKTIDSEITTIEQNAIKQNLTPEKTKILLSRLLQERDMLNYAVKYEKLARPLIKPFDAIANKLLGGFGGK